MTGWLVGQLPRPMAEDSFLPRFVGIVEEVASSVIGRIDDIEHHLDIGLAPPDFVRWLGSWLGVTLDPSLPPHRQRDVVRAAGRLQPWRGTRSYLEGLLAAYTGGNVVVTDSGGVVSAGQQTSMHKRVTVRLKRSGGLDHEQLLTLIAAEVPADAIVDLRIDEEPVRPEDAVPDVSPDSSIATPEDPGPDGFLPAMEG